MYRHSVPHRVFVVEVQNFPEQVEADDTYFFVCVRTASELGDGLPKRPHEAIGDAVLIPRLDLCPERVFRRRDTAKKQMKKVSRRLRQQGKEVNPWEPVYSLYVIELEKPKSHKSDLPPVYVGQTSIEVEQRYSQHIAGGRLASRKVTGKAVGLRMDLVPKVKLTSRSSAIAAETRLGNRLQRKGYKVYGPQGLDTISDSNQIS